jgi:hypothetical protein
MGAPSEIMVHGVRLTAQPRASRLPLGFGRTAARDPQARLKAGASPRRHALNMLALGPSSLQVECFFEPIQPLLAKIPAIRPTNRSLPLARRSDWQSPPPPQVNLEGHGFHRGWNQTISADDRELKREFPFVTIAWGIGKARSDNFAHSEVFFRLSHSLKTRVCHGGASDASPNAARAVALF